MAVIQPRGASVDEARTGLVRCSGAQAETPCSSMGATRSGARPDQKAAGDEHAHRPEHARWRLVGMLSVFRPGAPQEDRPVHFHEARDGQGADQRQGRGGEGRAGVTSGPPPGTSVPNRPR